MGRAEAEGREGGRAARRGVFQKEARGLLQLVRTDSRDGRRAVDIDGKVGLLCGEGGEDSADIPGEIRGREAQGDGETLRREKKSARRAFLLVHFASLLVQFARLVQIRRLDDLGRRRASTRGQTSAGHVQGQLKAALMHRKPVVSAACVHAFPPRTRQSAPTTGLFAWAYRSCARLYKAASCGREHKRASGAGPSASAFRKLSCEAAALNDDRVAEGVHPHAAGSGTRSRTTQQGEKETKCAHLICVHGSRLLGVHGRRLQMPRRVELAASRQRSAHQLHSGWSTFLPEVTARRLSAMRGRLTSPSSRGTR